jgi:1-acyl-sn-glycerol-3-phosphate acyltransferase
MRTVRPRYKHAGTPTAQQASKLQRKLFGNPPKVSDFIPPKNNRFFEWLGRTGLPVVLWWNNYDGINIAKSDLAKIKALGNARTVICSNHSHRHDPIFLFSLSAILKEQFNYIAAREIFDWWPFKLHGYCIQRVGAYSITRGTIDRPSLAMSKKVIAAGQRKLVVFPECEISGSDDRLLPVEPGLAALFLKSAEEVAAKSPDEPLYILPVALKYKYVEDISLTLSNSLTRIENELVARTDEKQITPHVPADVHQSLPDRFNTALRAFVAIIASEFKFGHANWANTEENIDFDSIIEGLIAHCAETLNVKVRATDAPQAVHELRNRLHELTTIDEYISPYRKRLRAERQRYYERLEKIFNTITRLAALKEFRVLSTMSQENLANGIDVLEREMFGKATQKGHRLVYLKVGDPINVMARFQLYKQNKRAEIAWLTAEIDRQLRDMLGIPPLIERKEERAA